MARRSKDSSLHARDLTLKHKLISEGPPARYHVLPDRITLVENSSVRRLTFGQRDVKMQNKILLMVGETGTGKTTLINVIINYILRIEFTDEVWLEITEDGEENHISDQTETQTTEITVYEVFLQGNPICLTIIDTPGYGNTRGTDMDKQIAENLLKLLSSDTGVKETDAVCLVVKASENQLTKWQSTIFQSILSLFGKDIENNIVICLTHSDGISPTNAINAIKSSGIPCRKSKENILEYFLFNNCQTEKRTTKYNSILHTAWEINKQNLKHLFVSLEELQRNSLAQTESVLTERKRLTAFISNLQNCIDYMKRKQKQLKETQVALEKIQDDIQQLEDFSIEVNKCYKEKVPIQNASWRNKKATSCSVCETNCHEYNCYLAPNAWWCEVIKSGYCTVCPGRCHYTKHTTDNQKYVSHEKREEMKFVGLYESRNASSDICLDSQMSNKFEDIKLKFETKKKEKKEKINIDNKIKEDLNNTKKKRAELIQEAYNTITKLSEIALNPDPAFIDRCLNFLNQLS